MNYNLLEEKWIPVLYRNGETERIGICKAFEDAHMIRQIAASNPMDRVSILRFLLALLCWCKGNRPDSFSGSSFPSDWFTKLADNKDCFNLLGNGKRFYQCMPDTKKNKLSANYLIQEIPTGTNFSHFRHSTDGDNGLCPACSTMGLLRLPVFATSGGRGKPPGINAKPPIYVISLGSSLVETLLFSWRKVSDSDLGTPAWEKPDLQLPKKGNVPLLMGLTWLPRRVWLDNTDASEANCISCGRREPLIRQCVFAGIGSTKADGDGQGRVWSDPHTISERGEDVMKPSNALKASDAAAGQWAKIMAGVLRGQKDDGKRILWVVGFATVKNDKYLEAMEYEIPLHVSDGQDIRERIEKIKKWQEEGSNLVRNASSRKHVEIRPIVDAIRPHVEGRVSARASNLLDDDAWEQAAREYSPMMTAIARSLSPGFTTSALERQKAYCQRNAEHEREKNRRSKEASWEEGRGQVTATAQYISVLTNLKSGELGLLRTHAGQGLDETVDGFDLFTGLWWPLRAKSAGAPRRKVAWLIAKLYASRPIEHSPGETLACQLRRCQPKEERARKRFRQKFDEMLTLALGKIEPSLQWALDLVASKDMKLDWVKLTDELSIWERKSTRLKWAKEFLNTNKGGQSC